jgi:RHS repeat-associated protein
MIRRGRPDKEVSYATSSYVQTAWRLAGINVTYKDSCLILFTCSEPVRSYAMQYETGLYMSRLKIWQEFDSSLNEVSRLTFAWSSESVGWAMPFWGGAPGPGSLSSECLIGEVNGDGKTDFWCKTGDSTGSWHAGLSTGNGWSAPFMSGPTRVNMGGYCFSGDLNGDAKTDFWCQTGDQSPNWHVALSTGNWAMPFWSGPGPGIPPSNSCKTGDLNGDGKTDFWCQTGDHTGSSHVALSTGNGWNSPFWTGPTTVDASKNCLVGDLNGDGKTDYWCQTGEQSPSWHVAISTGNGWNAPFWSGPAPGSPRDTCLTGDLNGDGKTDFWCQTADQSSAWLAAISTGTGWQISPWFGAGPGSMRDTCLTGDLNGDGKTDFWCQTGDNTGSWHVAISTGTSWITQFWSGPTRPEMSKYCGVGDLNGDGRSDFWCQTGNHSGTMHVGLSTGIQPNLLVSIQRNSGAQIAINYESAVKLSGPVCPTPCTGPSPEPSLSGSAGLPNSSPTYLVTQVTTTSDRDLDTVTGNDSFTSQYQYFNARVSTGYVHERGSLGFEKIKTTDMNSGNYKIDTYRQDKPFHGQAVVSRSYLSDNTLISEEIFPPTNQLWLCDANGCAHDPSNNPNPGLPKQFRAVGESQHKTYENGILISRKFSETQSYDVYGNMLVSRNGIEANTQTKTQYKFSQFINKTTTAYVIGLPYFEKNCLSAIECLEGDSNFISATKSYFDGQALGLAGDKHLVTRKETYVSTGTATGIWLPETYTYYDSGLLKDSVDGMGIRTEIEYDADYVQFPYTVRKIDGAITRVLSHGVDYRFSKPNYKLDGETGIEERTIFDAAGFVQAVEAKKNGVTIAKKTNYKSAYNQQPAWKKECVNYGAGFTQEHCSKKITDALGRVFREEYPEFVAGIEKLMAIEHGYDSRGREVKVSQPFDAQSGSPSQWNTKTYDAMGRVNASITFNNRTTNTDYLKTGLPTGTVSGIIVKSPDSKEKRTYYNIDGKPAIVNEANHDALGHTTLNYTYDDLARLSTVVSPQSKTTAFGTRPMTVGYIGRSSLQSYIDDPVAGRTDYDYYFIAGQPNFGKLKTETRAGYITAFEYSGGFGRVSKTTKAPVSAPSNILETILYQYDETDVTNGKGRLTALTHLKDGFTIKESYSYDDRGEVLQTVRRISHASEALCNDTEAMPCLQVFGKIKDELGRVTDMLYPDGTHSMISYVDAFQSFVSNIKHNGTTYAEYSDFSYDVAPHIGKITYGNGIVQQYTYVADTGLLDTFKISNAAPLIDLKYQYDPSYNIQRIEDNVISGLSIQFDYDALNRLKSAMLDSGVTRTYRFDRDGQPDSKGNLELKANRRMAYPDGKTFPTSDEVYNPDTAQWQSNQNFTWSANGKLLTKGSFSFSYDGNSMMTRATEVDPQNSSTIVGDTKFFYDHTGQRFLKTHLRNGVLIKTWYLGDGIELREKYIGASASSSGSFEAYQATKYIYGTDEKKLASITGNVKSTMPATGAGAMFALADHYSSSSIAGLANKVYCTFYGIYQHESTSKILRIATLYFFALLIVLYFISTQRKERAYPLWTRIAAVTILVSFVSVNCGTGNAPGSVPTDLAQSRNSIISALYTGLPTGTVYYSHNHLGSGALVTDSAGNEVFRITYTEYGEIDLANSGKWNATTEEFERDVSDAEIAIIAVKYTGQEYDPETGFYYYNARYYDPQLGVFTTPDTEFDEEQGSFVFNRHMYVRGNPIMYTDPTGHFFFSISSKGISFGINLGFGGIGIDIKWDKGLTVGANVQAGPRLGVDINGVGAGFNASATYGIGYNFGQNQGVSYVSAGVSFTSPIGTIGVSATASFGYRTGYEGTSAELFYAYGIGKVSGSVGWDNEGNFSDWRVGVDVFATKGFQTVSIGPSYGKHGFDVNAGYSHDLGGEVAKDIKDFERRLREKREEWNKKMKDYENFADDIRFYKKTIDDYAALGSGIVDHNKRMVEDFRKIGRGYKQDYRKLQSVGRDLLKLSRDIKSAGQALGNAFKCTAIRCASEEPDTGNRRK